MVEPRILWLKTLILSFFISLPAFADAIDRELVLGESFSISLKSDNLIEDYAALDLADYSAHFYLDDSSQTSKRVRLILTPYIEGEFELPAIEQGEINIKAQKIRVKPNPEVSVIWQEIPQSIFVNQWSSQQVGVVLQDRGLGVRLESNADQNFILADSPLSEKIAETKNIEYIYAQKFVLEGSQPWRPAYISVQNRSGGSWLFYPQPQQIVIKPSPSYLPADISIGKLKVKASQPWINLIGKVAQQKLEVKAINSNYLPDLREQLRVPFAENLQVRQNISSRVTEEGYQETLVLEQPFRALQTGFNLYPPIRVNWINTATGKLENTFIPAQTYLALPLWLAIILAGVGVVLGGIISFYIIKLLLPAYFWMRLKVQLKLAKNDKEIWQAYQSWAHSRGLHQTQTFGAWLKVYQTRFGKNSRVSTDILQLNQRFKSRNS